ncbi:hypothetical protein WKV44_08615 [Spirochaetia bacterium 38H-sp]|uniref:Uncharacterized protein n=1 Tax=Rarispira pelagica TaxID=3141764 RepID=A0ABU9UD66_9SPIR
MSTTYLKELVSNPVLFASIAGYFAGLAVAFPAKALLSTLIRQLVKKKQKKSARKDSRFFTAFLLAMILAVFFLVISIFVSDGLWAPDYRMLMASIVWAAIGFIGGIIPVLHAPLIALAIGLNLWILFSISPPWHPAYQRKTGIYLTHAMVAARASDYTTLRLNITGKKIKTPQHKLTIRYAEIPPAFILIPYTAIWSEEEASLPSLLKRLTELKLYETDIGNTILLQNITVFIKDNQLCINPGR